MVIRQLEPGIPYDAYWFDPMYGNDVQIGTAQGDENGYRNSGDEKPMDLPESH